MEDTTILVVDDEFRMRKLVKDFLLKENCNFHTKAAVLFLC